MNSENNDIEFDNEVEREAVAKLISNDVHSSELFLTTRMTLLRRVNAGDKKAFEEFYALYCPAMLKYLGLTEGSRKEKDQWDLVQTVFAKFYKTFAMVEDPDTGAKRIPRDLLSVMVRKNRTTGKTCDIKFRQYLITCLKNAVRTKWRSETKRGTVKVCSIDTRIAPNEKTTWKDWLEDQGVDPKLLDCADAQSERLNAVKGIWGAVVKGFLLDESMDDSVRDITYRSIAEGVSTAVLAEYWGVKENYVYQIKHRAIKKAAAITKEIYELLGDDNDDVQGDVDRLCEAVMLMKPSKHVDRFMIELAKELYRAAK